MPRQINCLNSTALRAAADLRVRRILDRQPTLYRNRRVYRAKSVAARSSRQRYISLAGSITHDSDGGAGFRLPIPGRVRAGTG